MNNENTNKEYDYLLEKDYETPSPDEKIGGVAPVVCKQLTNVYIENSEKAGRLYDKLFGHIINLQDLTNGGFPFDQEAIENGELLTSGSFINIYECTPFRAIQVKDGEVDENGNPYPYGIRIIPYLSYAEDQDDKKPLCSFEDEDGNKVDDDVEKLAIYVKRVFIMDNAIMSVWSDGRNELFVIKELIDDDTAYIEF